MSLTKAFELNKLGVTRIEVRECETRKGKAFCFDAYYRKADYPNFISAPYKTLNGATRKAITYLKTGKFSLYGNAE